MIRVATSLNNKRIYVHSIFTLTCQPHERLQEKVSLWLEDQQLTQYVKTRFQTVEPGFYSVVDFRNSNEGPGFEFHDTDARIAMLFKLTWT